MQSSQDARRTAALERWRWGTADDEAFEDALSTYLLGNLSKPTVLDSVGQGIGVLIESPRADADATLGQLLAAQDWRVPLLAADGLARRQSAGRVLAELLACWNSPAAGQHYALRHAIVLALAAADDAHGVAALIRLLPSLQGQLKYEALTRLTQRTGEDFGADVSAWQTWWSERPAGAPVKRIQPDALPLMVPWNRQLPQFFGMPIYAQRLLFVVDISNSMKSTLNGTPRLKAAQDELTAAIRALPEDASFNILFFNDRVSVWRPGLSLATPENRSSALQFVWSVQARDRTAVNDALEAAVDFPVGSETARDGLEQIVLLSDGKPTAGRITLMEAIVSNVTVRNRFKRIRIDTLGIDSADDHAYFLQDLADRNFGRYRQLR